jgi:hypothetical protein
MNALTTTPAVPAKRIHGFHLRLPVALLWLLLLPFAPLLLLVLFIVCAVYGVNPFGATAALLHVFAGLKGIHIEVQSSEVSFELGLF